MFLDFNLYYGRFIALFSNVLTSECMYLLYSDEDSLGILRVDSYDHNVMESLVEV